MTPDTQVGDKGGREKISRYEVISQLGEGGMGVVYKAHDPDLNKIVAVKVIQTSMLNDEQTVRFQREARALKDLKHTAIPEIYNFAVSRDGEPYLVMEFVQGESLSQFLHKHKPLESEYVVEIALQICEAMKHAHGRGIIHRDLKPANVILTSVAGLDFVVVKVIDFGLARLDEQTRDQDMTKTGLIMGSPPYMSPEQIQGELVDHRSDIYSMGCILYEMLTGEPPFRGKSPLATLTMHIGKQPASLAAHGVSDAALFDGVIGKALAKHPDQRYRDMEEMMEDLYVIADRLFVGHVKVDEPVAEDDSMSGLRTTIIKRNNRKQRQRKARLVTAIGALCVLVVGGAFFVTNQLLGPVHVPVAKVDVNNLLNSETSWRYGKDEGLYFAEAGPDITDAEFKKLRKRVARIEELRIPPTSTFTGEGLKYIWKAPILVANIQSDAFGDIGFKNLARIETLRKLTLKYMSNEAVTTDGLAAITNLPLTKLELSNSELPPDTVLTVSKMKEMVNLSFHQSSPVDFHNLKELRKMPRLDTLDLARTGLTDETLPNIGSLEHLKKLTLTADDISDARLDVILNFPLEELKLTETSVTDLGLATLTEIKTLTKLECKSCPGITPAGVARFKSKLPRCEVVF